MSAHLKLNVYRRNKIYIAFLISRDNKGKIIVEFGYSHTYYNIEFLVTETDDKHTGSDMVNVCSNALTFSRQGSNEQINRGNN